MKFLKTLFSKALPASGERPGNEVGEPATTSSAGGSPVCLTEDDGDEDPRTMQGSSLIAGDSFRDESIPWQLC